jgi:hypothetical protein
MYTIGKLLFLLKSLSKATQGKVAVDSVIDV